MDIQDEKVIVIGSGASGISAASLAASKKAKVSIYDQKTLEQHDENTKENLYGLENSGVKLLLGIDIIKHIADYKLIIKSPGVPMDLDFIQYAKEKGSIVIGEFEFAYRYCMADIIAITGTNGKTTTTSMVASIIKAYMPNTYVVGNIGRAFSEDVGKITKDDKVVAELSSYQLESSIEFHPKISSVLNIEADHLNRHGTMENYIKAKEKIFSNQIEEDFLVLNYDDPRCRLMEEKARARTIWFSNKEKPIPGVYVEDGYIVEHINNEKNIICHIRDLKVLGSHNVENALAAVAITSIIGVPKDIIQREVISFKGVAHRIEYVGSKKGIDFFNDSKATNPEAAIKGLLAMDKKIRLIVGGLDEGNDLSNWISLFTDFVDKAYVIGETKDQFAKIFKAQDFKSYEEFDSLEEAVEGAYKDAFEGECILLSPGCASWDMFRSFEERGDIFKNIFQSLEE